VSLIEGAHAPGNTAAIAKKKNKDVFSLVSPGRRVLQ
jgi:hypothetical protein